MKWGEVRWQEKFNLNSSYGQYIYTYLVMNMYSFWSLYIYSNIENITNLVSIVKDQKIQCNTKEILMHKFSGYYGKNTKYYKEIMMQI